MKSRTWSSAIRIMTMPRRASIEVTRTAAWSAAGRRCPLARRSHMASGATSLEVFLDEAWTEVHVDLHQRLVADGREAVDLAGLDDDDVAGAPLELAAVHHPSAPARPNELHFVVGMAMRAWPAAGLGVQEKHGDGDVTLIGAHEVVRASLEGQV